MDKRNEAAGLRVIVAAHKPYAMPQEEIYLPVHAGAALADVPMYASDAQGENISARNGLYCELTALYFAWKNLPASALGLVHYRRYFGGKGRAPGAHWTARVARSEELEAALERVPVILPRKRHYVIDTRRGQFIRAHGRAAYGALRDAMALRAPAYLPAFDATMRRTAGHAFNMFVMRRAQADAYCAWLFELLFETERLLREREPGAVTPRLFGYLAERMLDCYVETNGLPYEELPVVYAEGQDWLRKGTAFLRRRLRAGGREG